MGTKKPTPMSFQEWLESLSDERREEYSLEPKSFARAAWQAGAAARSHAEANARAFDDAMMD